MSLFVIPMAGLSSRFFKAGFTVPKYMLPIENQSMFEWSVSSFKRYFDTDHFLFIIRDTYNTQKFIHQQVEKMGIKNYQLVVLSDETRGQADTVYLGLQQSGYQEDLIIFNIDSRRHDYIKPTWLTDCAGYLEVFQGDGDHWSFVEPLLANSHQVKRTTEKERISDLCSDGLYYFRSRILFEKCFENAVMQNKFIQGELYVAPLYNHLVKNRFDVRFDCIDIQKIDFCGTPNEYKNILKRQHSNWSL